MPGRKPRSARISPAIIRHFEGTKTMKMRKLGAGGPDVSEIGLGCMGMSAYYSGRDEGESVATLERALDLGVTFFDSADMYGMGENETLVGRVLKPHRDRIVLATKFANTWTADRQRGPIRGDAPYVAQACDASLKRLGLDVIDLYYQHRVDPHVPIEETVGAMADLVRAGKVRFLGLSEAGPETIRRAHAVHPIAALQTEYSLWSRDPETEILSVTRELGIAFVPYSPLGRGFLTGQIKTPEDLESDDWRRNMPRFQGENFQKNVDLAGRIHEFATAKGCTPGQLALAWVLAQGQDIIPIPGTKRRKYLEENVRAATVSLSADELAEIDRVLPPTAFLGDRYPAEGMRAVNL
jgi:aryl-alcohol dehydrogenase-like predicted oxidoreductase